MSELTEGQIDNIRLAYRAAEKSGDDTIIQNRVQQLSRDFGISEDDVRSVVNGSKAAPAKPAPAKEHGISKCGGNRNDWTAEQIRKLIEMHNEGKGAAAIAKALGCDVKRVSMKLYNLKKTLHEPSTAKPPEIVPPSAPEEKATLEPESRVEKLQIISSPPLAVPSVRAHDNEEENPKPFFDMPAALLFMMEMVREHFGDDVTRVCTSNSEHYAACAFKSDGIEYKLKLEVLE